MKKISCCLLIVGWMVLEGPSFAFSLELKEESLRLAALCKRISACRFICATPSGEVIFDRCSPDQQVDLDCSVP